MAITINSSDDGETIYFEDYIEPPVEVEEWETPEQMMAHHQKLRESALVKLKKFGLSEDEAKTVIGF